MKTTLVNSMFRIILVCALLLQPWQACAAATAGTPAAGFPLAYQGESALVRVPAAAGDIAGGIAGGAIGIAVGVPLGIILTPAQKESIILMPAYGGYFSGMAGRLAGGRVAGAPFLLVQKIIREISRAFAAREYRYHRIFS